MKGRQENFETRINLWLKPTKLVKGKGKWPKTIITTGIIPTIGTEENGSTERITIPAKEEKRDPTEREKRNFKIMEREIKQVDRKQKRHN